MPNAPPPHAAEPNPVLEIMEALSNHHGQVDIHLDRVSLRLPFTGRPIVLDGTVSISMHLRELSDKERAAHAARQLRSLAH